MEFHKIDEIQDRLNRISLELIEINKELTVVRAEIESKRNLK